MYFQTSHSDSDCFRNRVGMKSLSHNNSKTPDLALTFTTGDKLMMLSQAEMSTKNRSDLSLKLSDIKMGLR